MSRHGHPYPGAGGPDPESDGELIDLRGPGSAGGDEVPAPVAEVIRDGLLATPSSRLVERHLTAMVAACREGAALLRPAATPAARQARRRMRSRGVLASAGLGVGLFFGGGLAAAGELPPRLQTAVASVARNIGVQLPAAPAPVLNVAAPLAAGTTTVPATATASPDATGSPPPATPPPSRPRPAVGADPTPPAAAVAPAPAGEPTAVPPSSGAPVTSPAPTAAPTTLPSGRPTPSATTPPSGSTPSTTAAPPTAAPTTSTPSTTAPSTTVPGAEGPGTTVPDPGDPDALVPPTTTEPTTPTTMPTTLLPPIDETFEPLPPVVAVPPITLPPITLPSIPLPLPLPQAGPPTLTVPAPPSTGGTRGEAAGTTGDDEPRDPTTGGASVIDAVVELLPRSGDAERAARADSDA